MQYVALSDASARPRRSKEVPRPEWILYATLSCKALWVARGTSISQSEENVMRALLFAAVMLLVQAAHAEDSYKKNYVGAQYLNSRSACHGFQDGLAPLGLHATCDRTDNGFRVYAGRYLTSIF